MPCTSRISTRRHFAALAPVLAALVLVAGACGSDSGSGEASGGGEGPIRVTDVWARTSPMEATNGAVYARIRNTSDRPDALVGASVPSSVSARVELHETVMTDAGDGDTTDEGMGGDTHGSGGTDDTMGDGMGGDTHGSGGMRMRPVDRIPVPAGGVRLLKPGDYHIMLIDLAGELKVGDTFPVTLRFERAGTLKVTAEVRR